jgi:hypothetical protein
MSFTSSERALERDLTSSSLPLNVLAEGAIGGGLAKRTRWRHEPRSVADRLISCAIFHTQKSVNENVFIYIHI